MAQAWLLGTARQICQGCVPRLTAAALFLCTQAARLARQMKATLPSLLHAVRQPSIQLRDVQHSYHHAPPPQNLLPCMPFECAEQYGTAQTAQRATWSHLS